MYENIRILLVCSPYYKEITENLVKGAAKVFKTRSIEYKIIYVPGALEIAPSIKFFSEKKSQNIFLMVLLL